MTSVSEAVTALWTIVGSFLTYVFDFANNPALATIALLPIVAAGIALVAKLIHHKHKV